MCKIERFSSYPVPSVCEKGKKVKKKIKKVKNNLKKSLTG